jgi:uncharacterized RDD family membrane protein YckC
MNQLRALPARKLRILSTVLWFFAAWYIANFAVVLFGANAMLGPLVGITAAVLIGGDPLRLIWSRPARTPATSGTTFAESTTR